jgi:predicted restriction endonuclease
MITFNSTYYPKAKKFHVDNETLNVFLDNQETSVNAQSLLIDLLNGNTTIGEIRNQIKASEALNEQFAEER